MRDASEGALAAPEGVAPSSMRCMLRHVYADAGVDDLPLEQVRQTCCWWLALARCDVLQ